MGKKWEGDKPDSVENYHSSTAASSAYCIGTMHPALGNALFGLASDRVYNAYGLP